MTGNTRFEWDPHKSEANRRKHGIDFDTAKLVFDDPLCLQACEGNDHGETRWRTIGEIGGIAVVIVSHTLREEGEIEITRIISARKAGRGERQKYEEASEAHR